MVKWALFYFSLFLIFRKQDCGEALVLFHQQANAAQTLSKSRMESSGTKFFDTFEYGEVFSCSFVTFFSAQQRFELRIASNFFQREQISSGREPLLD